MVEEINIVHGENDKATYLKEEKFLNNINKYIENAFSKSENDAWGYKINL